MLKAAIVLMLIATVVSLFSGLFFLVKDEGNSNRLVTALTVRVVLAVITLMLITWGFFSGQLGFSRAVVRRLTVRRRRKTARSTPRPQSANTNWLPRNQTGARR